MPPQMLFDLKGINTDKVMVTKEQIYQVNPHRYEFAMLDGIFHINHQDGTAVGYRDVRDDEFWVRGHIPGRPIFPGVLMIEAAAQLVSYYALTEMPGTGFLGFSGVEEVKFRGMVTPGRRILMLGKMIEIRTRRCIGKTQAIVDGQIVYEGTIVGMWI